MSDPTPTRTRRTEGVRVRGRAERVVQSVLRATAEELSRVGYAALRVEDVAVRSGVNKTTIYRRWPTKAELAGAALRELVDRPTVADLGSLREELLVMLRAIVEFASSEIGFGILQMLEAERSHPEVLAISRDLRDEQRRIRIALIERGFARGELPRSTRPDVIADLVFAPVFARLVKLREPVDEAYLRTIVDIVLAGARAIAR